MPPFHAVYYRAPDGDEPVLVFLDGLDDEVAAVLAQQIDRLNLLSDEVPHLRFPQSSQDDGAARDRVTGAAASPARAPGRSRVMRHEQHEHSDQHQTPVVVAPHAQSPTHTTNA